MTATQTPLTAALRSTVCASAGGPVHILATLVAPAATSTQPRQPADIALVIDRSGSMGGNKIQTARNAAIAAAKLLSPNDRLAIIAYDNEIITPLPLIRASGELVQTVERIVRNIDARGGTNLSGGWQAGCTQLAGDADASRIKTCILLTDGQANEGITDTPTLAKHTTELRTRGIRTSAFGIGAGFNEVLLGAMADAGGGAFQYIDDPAKLSAAIATEVQESLDVTARGVAIIVEAAPGIVAEVKVIGDTMPVTVVPGGWRIGITDLRSRQTMDVPIMVTMTAQPVGSTAPITVRVASEQDTMHAAVVLPVAIVTGEQALTTKPNPAVEAIFASMESAAAMRAVGAMLLAGDRTQAKAIAAAHMAASIQVADRLQDSALMAQCHAQEEQFQQMLAGDASISKSLYYGASNVLRSRSKMGATRTVGPPPQA